MSSSQNSRCLAPDTTCNWIQVHKPFWFSRPAAPRVGEKVFWISKYCTAFSLKPYCSNLILSKLHLLGIHAYMGSTNPISSVTAFTNVLWKNALQKNSKSCSKIVLPVFDSTLLYQTSILSNYDSNQSSKLIFMTLNLN